MEVMNLITPNFSLFLWILFLATIVDAVGHIVLGLAGLEKSQKYDEGDVVLGFIVLILMIIVLLA
jgi:hypothetical protein